jgi:uncharacterized SAM-binding protein YcdF (DUF218 family)
VLILMSAAVLIWFLGFLGFSWSIPRSQPIALLNPVDGIIVFTGSAGRIQAGITALEQGLGQRLLISGVNSDLSSDVIRSAIGGKEDLARCCIDLGRTARDTEGNALEAIKWAHHRDYDKILVITADWHMRRSLIELNRHGHGLMIHALPVKSEAGPGRLMIEYHKFLAAWTRAAFSPDRPFIIDHPL